MVGGGLYLCWMGYQMLRGALKKEQKSGDAPQVELAASGRSFMKGLLTNLANPKAIIYFGSVFSLFVGDSVGAGARWGIFVLIALETFGLPWWPACSLYRKSVVVINAGEVDRRFCRCAVRRFRHPSDHLSLSPICPVSVAPPGIIFRRVLRMPAARRPA